MKRLLCIVGVVALLVPLSAVPGFSQTTSDVDVVGLVNDTPELWFVELSGAPLADGGSPATIRAEKDAFRQNARRAGINLSERYGFDTLFNGFSVRVPRSQIAALGRVQGVKAIYPVVRVAADQDGPVQASPDMASAVAMTGASAVNTAGYTGKGIRVAVMDTGIDFHHQDLGGCFGPGCKVAGGYDFVGDAYNSGGTGAALVLRPDPIPDDCNGHGTHVAGIVAADGFVKGVAREATLYGYRVFGCEGTTDTDIMMAAMERALADGVQVLNMSIGASFQWPQYPTAVAATRLVNRGVSVVASIGNSGANGLYSASAPGLGRKVIGVAATDNTHVTRPAISISPDNTLLGYTAATGAPPPPTTGTFALARTGTPASTSDGCAALPAGSLTGQVALIRRGTCGFYDKALNAQNAGAAGVLLYNNAAGFLTPTVSGAVRITIPVVMLTNTDGALVDGRIAGGTTTMSWTDQLASTVNPTGGTISSFSSYGLSPDLSLKPDITAPGGSIFSTYPVELGSYASISGTSMASPHTAGAVALLLQAKPHTSAQAIAGILQNSAVPQNWWGNPGLGFLDNAHRQGAGMLRIDRAIAATTSIEPSELALGESEAGAALRTLTIRNGSPAPVTYTLTHRAALATGPNTFTLGFLNGPAAVSFSTGALTVPAGGNATVDVTIAANAALPDLSLYGGYIVATGDDGSVTRVPYGGIKGDYQVMNALSVALGFPFLGRFTGTGYAPPASNAVFTLRNGDVPYFVVRLHHASARFRVDIRDAAGRSWHRAYDIPYMGRNSTSTSFFALPFDGVTVRGNQAITLPNGTYTATISVLKALGDADNPAHVQTFALNPFTIAR